MSERTVEKYRQKTRTCYFKFIAYLFLVVKIKKEVAWGSGTFASLKLSSDKRRGRGPIGTSGCDSVSLSSGKCRSEFVSEASVISIL